MTSENRETSFADLVRRSIRAYVGCGRSPTGIDHGDSVLAIRILRNEIYSLSCSEKVKKVNQN